MKGSVDVRILFAVAALAFSANIWGYSIYLLDEAKNASCAREMLETGNWIVPTFNYQLRTDKPPLHYYFMASAYYLFGVNAFAARFFSVLFGLLTLWICYLFTKFHAGQSVAIYTTLVLLSSIGAILQFHLAVPDPFLIFFTVSGLFSLYHGWVTTNHKWILISYAAFGMAVLSKGPVGLIIPVLIAGVYFLLLKKVRLITLMKYRGLLILGIVVAPWFVAVAIETNGQWLEQFLVEHNIQRYIAIKEGHGGGILLIPLFFILMMMPFGLFIAPTILSFFTTKTDNLDRFCIVVVAVILIFYASAATKLPNYISPALPFASILIGKYLFKANGKFPLLWTIATAFLLVGIPFVPGLIAIDFLKSSDWQYFLLLPVGGILAVWFAIKSQSLRSVVAISYSCSLTTALLFYTIVPRVDKLNPVSAAMSKLAPHYEYASFHIFNPAFSFYLKKPISVFENEAGLEVFLRENENGVVLTRENVLSALKKQSLDTVLIHQDLFESTRTAILKNAH